MTDGRDEPCSKNETESPRGKMSTYPNLTIQKVALRHDLINFHFNTDLDCNALVQSLP